MVASEGKYCQLLVDGDGFQLMNSMHWLRASMIVTGGSILGLLVIVAIVTSAHTCPIESTHPLDLVNLQNSPAMLHFPQVAKIGNLLPLTRMYNSFGGLVPARVAERAGLASRSGRTGPVTVSAEGSRGASDGLYWLEVLGSGSSDDLVALRELAPQDRPADIEISTTEELQRRVMVRMPGVNHTTMLGVSETQQKVGCGRRIWSASLAAAAWVTSLGSVALSGDILELGSGIGVFGLAAGAMAAAVARRDAVHCSLTLSDNRPVLVSKLQGTIANNALHLDGLTSACALQLNWDNASLPDFAPHTQYDNIVAADCVFLMQHSVTLAITIVRYLKRGGSAYLVIPCFRDGQAVKETLKVLSQHGKISQVRAALVHRMDESAKVPGIYSMQLVVFHKTERTHHE